MVTTASSPHRVEVSSRIPEEVLEGLATGVYERLGGTIRNATSREIVGWLREAVEAGAPISADLVGLAANPNAAALNLALTGMGFAVVMKRLETIQGELREMQRLLETIDYKVDLSFYANFRAAIDLAANSFSLTRPEARRVAALQAINRFLEAEHHYSELADIELANQSPVADDYLVTLCLAYVTEAWCYLKLDEVETAERRLQEGQRVVRPRFERHVRTLLTSNPSAYLHPSVRPPIDLSRLARAFRWLTPGITDSAVFDAQRHNLFNLARQPQAWVDALPPAVRLPVKGRHFGQKAFAELSRQLDPRELRRRFAGFVGALDPRLKKGAQPVAEERSDTDAIFARLPETFALIETMIEHCSRFEAYLEEVRTMKGRGIGFDEWQALGQADGAGSAPIMYVSMTQRVH